MSWKRDHGYKYWKNRQGRSDIAHTFVWLEATAVVRAFFRLSTAAVLLLLLLMVVLGTGTSRYLRHDYASRVFSSHGQHAESCNDTRRAPRSLIFVEAALNTTGESRKLRWK